MTLKQLLSDPILTKIKGGELFCPPNLLVSQENNNQTVCLSLLPIGLKKPIKTKSNSL